MPGFTNFLKYKNEPLEHFKVKLYEELYAKFHIHMEYASSLS